MVGSSMLRWYLASLLVIVQLQWSIGMPPHLEQNDHNLMYGTKIPPYHRYAQSNLLLHRNDIDRRNLQDEEKYVYEHKMRLKHSKNAFPSQKLRKDLMEGYDKGSYPWDYAWEKSRSTHINGGQENEVRKGLDVEVGLNFHRVYEVDVANSVADLVVWVRHQWTDPRLTWNPENYGNLTTAWFWVGGSGMSGETSEIWTPDIELWNMETSLSESMVDTFAVVTYTGNVFWSRPGHIRSICKFSGLERFPFDELGCTLEFGSWSFSGLYIRPIKYDKIGYSIGGSHTAGEAYAEYSLTEVICEEKIYPPYPSDPESDWPVLLYHVSFSRASMPYLRGYFLLQIILNFAGFVCFWLPPACGERMGLAITAMLASVASDLSVSEKLPNANELTWFAEFSIGSTIFASMVLFESAIVIYFTYHTGSHLFAPWMVFIYTSIIKLYESIFNRRGQPNNNRRSDGKNLKQNTVLDETKDETKDNDFFDDEDINNFNGEDAEESAYHDGSSAKTAKKKKNARFSLMKVEHNLDEQNNNDDAGNDTPSLQRNYGASTLSTFGDNMAREADDFKTADEMKNNAKWQRVAKKVDEYSRVAFPLVFCVFIAQIGR